MCVGLVVIRLSVAWVTRSNECKTLFCRQGTDEGIMYCQTVMAMGRERGGGVGCGAITINMPIIINIYSRGFKCPYEDFLDYIPDDNLDFIHNDVGYPSHNFSMPRSAKYYICTITGKKQPLKTTTTKKQNKKQTKQKTNKTTC